MMKRTQEQYEAEMAEYIARRDKAMADAGVAPGDVLEWHAGENSPLGGVTVFKGTLFITKRGAPRMRLDGSRKSMPWHKGWKS